jgi:MFS family permease
LIVVGLLIRLRIMETPLFASILEKKQTARAPVREVVSEHWREVLLSAGSRIVEQSCFYLFTVSIIAYARDILELEGGLVLKALCAAAALEFFTIPVFGWLGDSLSRKTTYTVGCIAMALFAFPYYWLLNTRNPALVYLAVIAGLAGAHAILYSVQASLIPELFGTRLRYTGASLGYQLASIPAGGLAPLLAEWLLNRFHGQSWPLALYVVLISVISLACVHRLAETSRRDISAME